MKDQDNAPLIYYDDWEEAPVQVRRNGDRVLIEVRAPGKRTVWQSVDVSADDAHAIAWAIINSAGRNERMEPAPRTIRMVHRCSTSHAPPYLCGAERGACSSEPSLITCPECLTIRPWPKGKRNARV